MSGIGFTNSKSNFKIIYDIKLIDFKYKDLNDKNSNKWTLNKQTFKINIFKGFNLKLILV